MRRTMGAVFSLFSKVCLLFGARRLGIKYMLLSFKCRRPARSSLPPHDPAS